MELVPGRWADLGVNPSAPVAKLQVTRSLRLRRCRQAVAGGGKDRGFITGSRKRVPHVS